MSKKIIRQYDPLLYELRFFGDSVLSNSVRTWLQLFLIGSERWVQKNDFIFLRTADNQEKLQYSVRNSAPFIPVAVRHIRL